MAARIALVLSAAFLCLMLGLVSAPATPATVAPAHPLRLADLQLAPSAEGAAAAAAVLAGSAPRPPDAGGPKLVASARPVLLRPPPPPPPPPPPGADEVLRGSVAAVTDDGGRLSLVLAGGGRRLREGERFMGWTVASVNRSGAVLAKGGARREVSFFAPRATGAATDGLPSRVGPATLPARRPVAPPARAPTAEDFFRGFKG